MKREDYPLLMDATHVAQILKKSKRVAYEIMEETDFPLIRIRRSKYVNREEFFNWLDKKKDKAAV